MGKYFISGQRGLAYYGRVGDHNDTSGLVSRESVSDFSRSSRKRLKKYLRNSLAEYKVFITLTYPDGYGVEWKTCARNLRALGERLRLMQGSKKNWSIFWFREWTQQARIHYHLFGTHWISRIWLSDSWYETVGSKDDKHRRAGTNIKALYGGRLGLIKYASKYASKEVQKNNPNPGEPCGRYWGVIGCRVLMSASIVFQDSEFEGLNAVERCSGIRKVIYKHVSDETVCKDSIQIGERNIYFYKWDVTKESVSLAIIAAIGKEVECGG